jgi:hypothetical protein
MRLEKNYIILIFLLLVIILDGCRLLINDYPEPESVVEPVYFNTFTIISPTYSSFWKPGDRLEIKWITSGSVEKVDIQLYRKTTLIKDLKDNLNNDGSFIWYIPNNINHSLHYHIKLINHNNADEHELSDRFAIVN